MDDECARVDFGVVVVASTVEHIGFASFEFEVGVFVQFDSFAYFEIIYVASDFVDFGTIVVGSVEDDFVT
jgi:hypothetical protein